MSERVFVGLGGNEDDSREVLCEALTRLDHCCGVRRAAVSSLYRTDPVGYTQQDRFFNAVALFRAPSGRQADPDAWLRRLLAVEAELGRRRDGPRWGPRRVDLDLLAIEDRTRATPHLLLPHPRIAERRFVLAPWAELDPGFAPPGWPSVGELLGQCPDDGAVERVAGPEWCPA